MSKYGDFEVVRTDRRVPKKATDPNVEADGKREYSFLKCPHCKTEDIIIASLNIHVQKHAVIREHITVCPEYTGERPFKRCKEKKESTAIVVKAPTVPPNGDTPTFSNNTPTVSIDEFQVLKAKVEKLEDKATLYDGVLAAVMPSLALPLTAPEETARITLREAAIKDVTPQCTTLTLAPSSDVIIAKNVHNDMLAAKEAEMKAKDTWLAVKEAEIEAKDKWLAYYNSELSKVKYEKWVVEQEAKQMAASAAARVEKLQKECDALKAKFEAQLKSKEQLLRMRQGQKRNAGDMGAGPSDIIQNFKAFEKAWMLNRQANGRPT